MGVSRPGPNPPSADSLDLGRGGFLLHGGLGGSSVGSGGGGGGVGYLVGRGFGSGVSHGEFHAPQFSW